MNSISASPYPTPPKQAIVIPIRIFQEEPESYDAAPQPKRFVMATDTDVVRTILGTLGGAIYGTYAFIESYCNAEGKAWPSHETIARGCKAHTKTIERHIEQLIEAGWITREKQTNRFGFQTTNIYTLPHHPKPHDSGTDIPETKDTKPHDSGTDITRTEHGHDSDTTPHKMSDEVIPSYSQGNDKVNPSVSVDADASKKQESKPRSKNSAVPKDFTLTPELRSWGVGKSFLESDLEAEVDSFVDYWTGRGVTRADWNATFRNWMQNQRKWNKLQSQQQSSPRPYTKPQPENIRTHAHDDDTVDWLGDWDPKKRKAANP